MNDCKHFQPHLALRREEPDAELEAHLAACPDCARAARRTAAFDTALRSTLIMSVPDDLTARLLALVPGLNQPLVRSRRWILQRRALLVGGGLAMALTLAMLVYGLYLVGASLGVGDMLASASTWPGIAIDWLYRHVPSSRQVVATLITLRQPVQWAVFAALIWLAWDTTAARQNKSERTLAG
ncbi:MAG TPA: hypothetical protein VD886_15620 [Herpetosiphonaceae bacterium]|nr:hypothetical protein [Herpetosiphonaceae bacterium]